MKIMKTTLILAILAHGLTEAAFFGRCFKSFRSMHIFKAMRPRLTSQLITPRNIVYAGLLGGVGRMAAIQSTNTNHINLEDCENGSKATETSTISMEATVPTSVLARCHLQYAKDNRPDHRCTVHIKKPSNVILKCSMKDTETEEPEGPSLCSKLMQHLYLLSCGTFPRSSDGGLNSGPYMYIHPRSDQCIEFVLHFDPSALDYPHEWGGPSCTFDESDITNQQQDEMGSTKDLGR